MARHVANGGHHDDFQVYTRTKSKLAKLRGPQDTLTEMICLTQKMTE